MKKFLIATSEAVAYLFVFAVVCLQFIIIPAAMFGTAGVIGSLSLCNVLLAFALWLECDECAEAE